MFGDTFYERENITYTAFGTSFSDVKIQSGKLWISNLSAHGINEGFQKGRSEKAVLLFWIYLCRKPGICAIFSGMIKGPKIFPYYTFRKNR
jgi:hypothetical protein